MKRIYFFDFDGTISRFDSFILFSFFSLTLFKFLKYWIITIFLLPKYLNNKSRLKERFFKNFESTPESEFNEICNKFSNKILSKIIKKSFLNFISKINKDDKIVIVSASISNYLKPWCDKMKFEIISTELEVEDGLLTGFFLTKNCNGYEKTRRIKEKYNLNDYDEIHVFGDTKNDKSMLRLGHFSYYKFFK
jgi:HAD superfamily phosphoserine phosphatase-like hydrolase